MLFAVPVAQVWLKMVSFVAAEILVCHTYQVFFQYISWDKYHHTPILFMAVLLSKTLEFIS